MLKPDSPVIATRCSTHRVAASFVAGSRARCATSAKITRSTPAGSTRRPAAARRIAAPIPSRSQRRSRVHAPPRRRESRTSTSPGAAATPAPASPWSGVTNREIEDTNRASASLSTFSARPKLWITFAVDTPMTGCRSLCASCRYATTDPS